MSNELVQRIKTEIRSRGWSGRELARQSGVSQSSLAKILADEIEPSADFVIKISLAIDMLPETGLHLAGILPPLPDDDSPLGHEAAALVRGLPAHKQRIALRFLRSLYDWPDDD